MNQEDWTTRKWRPYMAWVYMSICILDFALFPILWSILQAHYDGQVTNQWDPLTLKGAGLFHMAMGAVLGVAAYGRSQEKLAGVTPPAPPSPIRPTPSIPINTYSDPDPQFRNTRND